MKKEYIDKTFKILSGIDDVWILKVIYRFVTGMVGAELDDAGEGGANE